MGCPICLNGEATESLHNRLPPNRQMRCSQCGDFGISEEAVEDAASIKTEDRWRLSAWIREYSPPIVRWEDIEQALKAAVPGLLSRPNRMLQVLNQRSPRGSDFSSSTTKSWHPFEAHVSSLLTLRVAGVVFITKLVSHTALTCQ